MELWLLQEQDQARSNLYGVALCLAVNAGHLRGCVQAFRISERQSGPVKTSTVKYNPQYTEQVASMTVFSVMWRLFK